MFFLLDIEFVTNPAVVAQANFEALDPLIGAIGQDPENVLIGEATKPTSLAGGIAWKLGTAPTVDVADQVSLWVGDRDVGQAGLRLRSESGILSHFGDRVGLGTLSPENMLHVVGAGQIMGNLMVGTGTPADTLANGLMLITGTAATGTVAAGHIALWFDGTDLRARIGTTDYTFTKT